MTEEKLEKINELKEKLDRLEVVGEKLRNREKGDKLFIRLDSVFFLGCFPGYDLTDLIDDSLFSEIERKVRHNIIDKMESLKKEFESL